MARCRYIVNLKELQIVVASANADWRAACDTGTSEVHVVDKFSIQFEFER